VVLDDADLDAAVRHTASNAFYNTGQTCTAFTRLLVPADRQAEAVSIAADAAPAPSI